MKNTLILVAAVILFLTMEVMTAARFSFSPQVGVAKGTQGMPPMQLVYGYLGDDGTHAVLSEIRPSGVTVHEEFTHLFAEGEFSFDGSSIAYCNCGDRSRNPFGIYVTNLARRDTKMITPLATKYCVLVRWSPDGRYLSYFDGDTDEFHVITLATCEDRIWPNIKGGFRHSWNPKGTQIVFERGYGGERELFITDLNGNVRQLTSLRDATHLESVVPVWSRDGSQIAFIVMEVEREKLRAAFLDFRPGDIHPFDRAGGKSVLHTIAPDGTGLKRFALLENAYTLGWSMDNEWIIFSSDGGRLMRVRRDGRDLGVIATSLGYEHPMDFSLAPIRSK